MKKVFLILGCIVTALVLDGPVMAQQNVPYFGRPSRQEPMRPGETLVWFKNIDPGSWSLGRDYFGTGSINTLFCKWTDCPQQTRVIFDIYAWDRQSTQKDIDQMLKRAQDNSTRSGSKVAPAIKTGKYKGYPTYSYDFTREVDDMIVHGVYRIIVIGSRIVSMDSRSKSREQAVKSVDHLMPVIQIEDGGPVR